jgi:hypothetical protein
MRRRSLAVVGLAVAWLVVGAAVAQASSLAGRVEVGGPNRHTQQLSASLNWSGWGATSKVGKFNYVHSRFVQPAITCNGTKHNWTSEWVGLDGFASNTVEQDGTDAFCGGADRKTPHYAAWYELYPAPSINVFRVHPGDTIDTVVFFKHGKFHLTVADLTTHRSATHVAACSACLRSSAEWIVERPALCANASCTKAILTALANFGSTTMRQDWARVDGQKVTGIRRYTKTPIDMVQPKPHNQLQQLDATSPLFPSGDAFGIKWLARGGIYPLTL